MSVAGPGALLISKLFKLGERAAEERQRRLEPKAALTHIDFPASHSGSR